MGSSAASPSASPRPTASSRPPLAPAARAIRAAVASGGYLVDRATERGAVRREYVGGDVAIATVPRGCDFRAFLVAVRKHRFCAHRTCCGRFKYLVQVWHRSDGGDSCRRRRMDCGRGDRWYRVDRCRQ